MCVEIKLLSMLNGLKKQIIGVRMELQEYGYDWEAVRLLSAESAVDDIIKEMEGVGDED